MTLLRETPKDHGLLLDHNPQGKRRLSITLASRTAGRNGRRLRWTQSVGQNRGHVKSGSCCLKRVQ